MRVLRVKQMPKGFAGLELRVNEYEYLDLTCRVHSFGTFRGQLPPGSFLGQQGILHCVCDIQPLCGHVL